MPSIQALKTKLADESVNFVLVSDESAEVLKGFAQKHGLALPLYRAEKFPAVYRVGGRPTTCIIDRNGMIVDHWLGTAGWDSPQSVDFLRGLLER